jgi:hypothetical protein
MPPIELRRSLQHYFAHAEVERHGEYRRFSISLPYRDGPKLERLQWWWRFSDTEDRLLGESGLAQRREREIERFRRHIERWLEQTGQHLCGEDPIPRIESIAPAVAADEATPAASAPVAASA